MSNDLERVRLTEILTGPSEGAVSRELARMSRAGLLAGASPVIRTGQGYAVKVIRIAGPQRRIRWGIALAMTIGTVLTLGVALYLLAKLVSALAALVAALLPLGVVVLVLLALSHLGGGGGTSIVQSIVIKR